jgi:hypothetical protein
VTGCLAIFPILNGFPHRVERSIFQRIRWHPPSTRTAKLCPSYSHIVLRVNRIGAMTKILESFRYTATALIAPMIPSPRSTPAGCTCPP